MARKSRSRRSRKSRFPRIKWRTGITWVVFIAAAAALSYVALFLGQGGGDARRGSSVTAPAAQAAENGPVTAGSPGELPNRPPIQEAKAEGRTNILFLGVDRRMSEREQPTRSDTIMVATIDRRHSTAGLLSIPRDLYVSIPECAEGGSTGAALEHKVNTANFWGDYWKCPGGGPALAAKTIELNLGIPIDYYVSVDFKAFEQAIDAIGGITVNVEKELTDANYPDDENDGGVITVHFDKGRQHLDGRRALQYARTRHPDSDFGRMRRQQQVLMAVRQKLLEPGTWPRLPAMVQALYGSVRTNAPMQEVLALANVARGIDAKDIVFKAIDSTMVTATTAPNGAEVLMPKWPAINDVVEELFITSGG